MKTLGLIFGTIVLFWCTSFGAQFSSEWMYPTASRSLGSWAATPDSILYDDASRCLAANGNDSMCAYGFYPMLPADAIVDSIFVRLDVHSTGTTVARRHLRISLTADSGVTDCSDRVSDTADQSTDAVSTVYSGSNTMTNAKWACTATLAQMVSRGFGVIVRDSSGGVAKIDYLRLRIVFTSASAHYMTYGRGANECTDAYLRQDAATTNTSADTFLYVGSTTGIGDAQIGIFNFGKPAKDSIASRTVTRAYLQLHSYQNSVPARIDSIQFNALRRLDASMTQMTYNIFKTANNWTTAGAFNTSSDIYGSLSIYDSSWYLGNARENRLDVTELLQSLDGANTDSVLFSLRDLTTSAGGTKVGVSSADASTADFRPFLRILTGSSWPGAATPSTPPRRRRNDLSMLDKIRIYSFTDKGALQCAGQ